MEYRSIVRIPQSLIFNKTLRIKDWYTYPTFAILWLMWFFAFQTYLDTSLLLMTKIILITLEIKIWVFLLTTYEDLSFFKSLVLVYRYYFAPKLYLEENQNLKWIENIVIVKEDIERKKILSNPSRKVLTEKEKNKIKKIKTIEETEIVKRNNDQVIKIKNLDNKINWKEIKEINDSQENKIIKEEKKVPLRKIRKL